MQRSWCPQRGPDKKSSLLEKKGLAWLPEGKGSTTDYWNAFGSAGNAHSTTGSSTQTGCCEAGRADPHRGASPSQHQAPQRDEAGKKYAAEALSALTAVLSEGTGKCSSTQIDMAQNNPRHSGIQQEQTARERCSQCILSNFCPCGPRARAAEGGKRQKKGPAWQKAIIQM